jgi:cell division cycle protein 37
MLKKVIAEMPEDEARYHMKRCIDSGMWIPPKDDEEPGDEPVEETAS